jgi:AcrR family transcriptional regulator
MSDRQCSAIKIEHNQRATQTVANTNALPLSDATNLRERVVDTALTLAVEKGSWSAVRLHDVADRLSVPTPQILDYYRDLDAVADAWFLRGLKAMVAPKPADFLDNPEWRRIEICLVAWFDALAEHRRVSAQILGGKLHLSHPHHWVPMVFNLSRTIQWLREAAQLPAVYGTRRAQREEVGLTALFVAALLIWTRDETVGQERTKKFLRRELAALA